MNLGIIHEDNVAEGASKVDSIEAVPFIVKRPSLEPDLQIDTDVSGDEIDYTHVIFSWGQGMHGQLGLHNTRNQHFPQLVRELMHLEIAHISVGGQHSVAVSTTGRCFGWGGNKHGQLGLGDTHMRKTPTSMHVSKSPFCNSTVKYVACGLFNTAVIGGKRAFHAFKCTTVAPPFSANESWQMTTESIHAGRRTLAPLELATQTKMPSFQLQLPRPLTFLLKWLTLATNIVLPSHVSIDVLHFVNLK